MNNFLDNIAGVLNIAYYQFSGDYMLYCTDNGLYLRDYSGYSVEIDRSIEFLPQLSRFLRIKSGTKMSDSKSIFYGAYQVKNHKFYHIPYHIAQYYIDNDYHYKMPDRCVILKSPNEDLTSVNYGRFYQNSDVLKTYDLYKLGIDSILTEFLSLEYQDRIKLKFPVEFVWADNNSHILINLYGWNYDKECVDKITYNITDYVLNMLDGDDSINFISNLILEKYNESHLIFPRFLNLAFEFEYTIPTNLGIPEFQNFFGYLTYTEEKDISILEENTDESNQIGCKLYIELNTPTRHEYRNVRYQVTERLQSFEEVSHNISIQEVEEQPEEILFNIGNLSTTTIFEIEDLEHNEIILRYRILNTDLKSNLYQSVIYIFNKLKNLSSNYFVIEDIHITDNKCSVKIEFSNKSSLKIYNDSMLLHTYTSNSIKLNDVLLISPLESIRDVISLDINGSTYNIVEVFTYDNQNIIRLDRNPNIQYITTVPVYKTYTEKLLYTKPIPFLQNSSLLHKQPDYDFVQYFGDLNSPQFRASGIEFLEPYAQIPQNTDSVVRRAQSNLVTNILSQPSNIIFKNSICDDISEHTMNYDLTRFDTYNGCDVKKQFNYFLINLIEYEGDITRGIIPPYLNPPPYIVPFDNRYLRYVVNDSVNETETHIRSLVYKISNERCQTIFLGKSYLLESKYDGYRFSIVYRYNTNDTLPMYYVRIDNLHKYLDVYINYRFPFLSLISSENDSSVNMFDISLMYIDTDVFLNSETATNDYTYGHRFNLIFGTLLDNRHFEYVRSRGFSFDKYYRRLEGSDHNQYLVFLAQDSFANFVDIYGRSYTGNIDCYFTKKIREHIVNDTDDSYVTRIIAYMKIVIEGIEYVDEKFVICSNIKVIPYPDGYYQNEIIITLDEDDNPVVDDRGYLQMYEPNDSSYDDVQNRKLRRYDNPLNRILQDKYRHYYHNPINPIPVAIENIPEKFFMLNFLNIFNPDEPYSVSTELGGDFYQDCNLNTEWYRLVYRKISTYNIPYTINPNNPNELHNFQSVIEISVVVDNGNIDTLPLIDVVTHTNRFWAIDNFNLNNPSYIAENYRQEFIERLNQLSLGETYEFDMLDYNPFWYMVERYIGISSISLMNTVSTVNELLSPITFDTFSQYIENNLLPIVDGEEVTNNSVYIKNIELSENTNMDNIILYRFSSFYEPNLTEVDIFNFSQYWYVRNDVKKIKTLFSDDFIDGLKATGFWKECVGYPISSLYCGQNDIELTLFNNENENIDIVNLMILNRVYSQSNMVIGDNSEYISRNLDYNYEEYISKSYIKYVLTYMYSITKVLVDNKLVKYEFNIKDFILNLSDFGRTTKIYLNRK